MKKFNMPTAYTILFCIITAVAILTWIIPAGEWVDGVYQQVAPNPQGIYNVLSAPVQGFFDAVDIALFVLVIGGFLGVVMKTGALDAGIGFVLDRNKGREYILIPILMFLFGLGGTTYGMAEETIAFYPLIIPVFLAAGYDVVTAVMVILLGAGSGVLASTINPFSIGAASDAVGISLGLGIGHRALLFVIVQIAAITYTMRYAAKVKADPTKSVVADLHESHKSHFLHTQSQDSTELTKRHKSVLALFALTFVIMILGVIPWAWKFDITIFENAYNALAENVRVLGLEPNTADTYWDNYDSIKTHSAALGDWWFGQMTVLFFIMSILIGFVNKMKEKELVDTFVAGARDLLGVALIIGVSRGIKIIMTTGGMDATVLHWGSTALQTFGKVPFINLTFLFYLPMAFLIPSTSGLAGASMPIMGPLGELVFGTTNGVGASIVITAYSAATGIVNQVTPTSGVVMGALAIARLPYDRWFKHVLKYLGILSLISMLLLSAVTILA